MTVVLSSFFQENNNKRGWGEKRQKNSQDQALASGISLPRQTATPLGKEARFPRLIRVL